MEQYNKLNTIEKAWFTLGRCFNHILPQEQINVLHRLDLFMGNNSDAVSHYKEEKYYALANEISRFANVPDMLLEAKDLFSQAKQEGLQNNKEMAQYYFSCGNDYKVTVSPRLQIRDKNIDELDEALVKLGYKKLNGKADHTRWYAEMKQQTIQKANKKDSE